MQDNKVLLSDSLKSIVNVIEDIRRTMKEMDIRVKSLDHGLDKLEAELERQLSVQERTTREIQKIKNELEPVKAAMHANEQAISAMKKSIPAVFSANSDAESLNTLIHITSSSEPEIHKSEPAEHNIHCKVAEMPILPGNGFSHVTLNYLKKLGGK